MLLLQLALSALLLGGEGPDPSNQFDWTIASGETFIFNTVSQVIVSSPPHSQQTVLNGFVNVRNFTIEDGGVLKVEGRNPMVLCVSGTVLIEGQLSIDGSSSPGVLKVNSTSIAEPGAPGQGGGGSGGTGSPFTTMSSPVGGSGSGAFNIPSLGGQGGEAAWDLSAVVAARRGAGGGGGVFGPNQRTPLTGMGLFNQTVIGLDAEPGFDNKLASNGVLSGPGPALGGAAGTSPFTDGNQQNDFFGTMFVPGGGSTPDQLVGGELRHPWAGAGGGAGGDASRPKNSTTWPGYWHIGGDEKGAGGGGGAGSLRILSLGPIVFGPQGEVTANGGNGGGGENTLFLNRIGGGSGGGSGGHIILETAEYFDFSQVQGKALRALGGQGGAGAWDVGGAFKTQNLASKQTKPRKDACPDGYPTTTPPNQCLGHVDGAGGDGGPGVIQLHTPRGARDIRLRRGRRLADLTEPRVICWPGGCRMLVSFGPGGAPAPARASRAELWRVEGWSLESMKMFTPR